MSFTIPFFHKNFPNKAGKVVAKKTNHQKQRKPKPQSKETPPTGRLFFGFSKNVHAVKKKIYHFE